MSDADKSSIYPHLRSFLFFQVENRINLVLAGQLSTVDESELELELELILKGIAAAEPKAEEVEEVEEVEADSAEAAPEAMTAESDGKEDVEQDYSSMLPEVPDGPLPAAVSPKSVTPRTATERVAMMS